MTPVSLQYAALHCSYVTSWTYNIDLTCKVVGTSFKGCEAAGAMRQVPTRSIHPLATGPAVCVYNVDKVTRAMHKPTKSK